MDSHRLRELLDQVHTGTVSVNEAAAQLEAAPFTDLGFAKVDDHRALRCGFPEVVLCDGKTVPDIVAIASHIIEAGQSLLATRASEEVYEALHARYPQAQYHARARAIVHRTTELPVSGGTIVIVTAGTSDIPVAEEARVTADVMGNRVETVYDAGVAGIHRLLRYQDMLRQASVIIVVAGMEGALASVVGGLVNRPVIAVPTSVGYGASFGGLAPLLTMLNSCAAGVAVVNIDNGFGAGYIASLINSDRLQPTRGTDELP